METPLPWHATILSRATFGRASVVTEVVGQINGGLSDCGPPMMQGEVRTLERCDNDKYPYPILIDTRILDLEWAATIYRDPQYLFILH